MKSDTGRRINNGIYLNGDRFSEIRARVSLNEIYLQCSMRVPSGGTTGSQAFTSKTQYRCKDCVLHAVGACIGAATPNWGKLPEEWPEGLYPRFEHSSRS